MVKSYSISLGEDESKVDRFVALMLPSAPLPPRDPQGAGPSRWPRCTLMWPPARCNALEMSLHLLFWASRTY